MNKVVMRSALGVRKESEVLIGCVMACGARVRLAVGAKCERCGAIIEEAPGTAAIQAELERVRTACLVLEDRARAERRRADEWERKADRFARIALEELVPEAAPDVDDERAREYLVEILEKAAPEVEPLPDLLGVVSQVDNLLAGRKAGSGAE